MLTWRLINSAAASSFLGISPTEGSSYFAQPKISEAYSPLMYWSYRINYKVCPRQFGIVGRELVVEGRILTNGVNRLLVHHSYALIAC